jgi:predicted dehydrogenase
MAKPLKVAVVGTNIGCTLHVRALRSAGFEVKALVGRNAEQTAARAAHFSIPMSLTSFHQALDSDVDAVVLATPPATHHEFALQAFAAGKHVLCEKPLAIDVGRAREMRDAAVASGLVHMVVHEYRWYAQNALLRRVVRGGGIGTPIQMTALFDHWLCAAPENDVPDWWKSTTQGGGWLRNYNAHGIDLIRYMVSDFAAVSGMVHAGADRGMTSDDSYAAAFVLTNGVQGVMAGSARARDYFSSTRVIGSDGTASLGLDSLSVTDGTGPHSLELPSELQEELRGTGPAVSGPSEKLPHLGDSLYAKTHSSDYGFAEQVALCSAFAAKIRNRDYRNPAIADFDDGLAHMEVIEAVERSRAERRWIDLV